MAQTTPKSSHHSLLHKACQSPLPSLSWESRWYYRNLLKTFYMCFMYFSSAGTRNYIIASCVWNTSENTEIFNSDEQNLFGRILRESSQLRFKLWDSGSRWAGGADWLTPCWICVALRVCRPVCVGGQIKPGWKGPGSLSRWAYTYMGQEGHWAWTSVWFIKNITYCHRSEEIQLHNGGHHGRKTGCQSNVSRRFKKGWTAPRQRTGSSETASSFPGKAIPDSFRNDGGESAFFFWFLPECFLMWS